jgi:hypothetical protein
MATAKLIVFCTPEELWHWLEEMKEMRDAAVLWFVKSRDQGQVVRPGEPLPPLRDAWRIFLLPASEAPGCGMDLEDVQARERGWAARPCMRGRAFSLADGLDSGRRRRVGDQLWFQAGEVADAASQRGPVEALNVVTGGAEIYRDRRVRARAAGSQPVGSS